MGDESFVVLQNFAMRFEDYLFDVFQIFAKKWHKIVQIKSYKFHNKETRFIRFTEQQKLRCLNLLTKTFHESINYFSNSFLLPPYESIVEHSIKNDLLFCYTFIGTGKKFFSSKAPSNSFFKYISRYTLFLFLFQ